MKHLKLFLTAAALALFASLIPAGAEEEAVKFTFNPPAPLTFTEETITKRATIAADVDPDVETSKLVTRVNLGKVQDGYTYSMQPLSFIVEKAGKVINDPILDIIQTNRYVLNIDTAGKVTKVNGQEGVKDAAMKLAPKEMAPALEKMLDPKLLAEKEIANWDGRIGDFAGTTAEKNHVWIRHATFPMPTGADGKYYVASVFTGMVEKDGRQLARIRFLFTTDQSRLRVQLNDLARDIITKIPALQPLPASPGFTISGQGERLIDPATMLIYEEKAERNVQITVAVGKDSSTSVIIEEFRETKVSGLPAK